MFLTIVTVSETSSDSFHLIFRSKNPSALMSYLVVIQINYITEISENIFSKNKENGFSPLSKNWL